MGNIVDSGVKDLTGVEDDWTIWRVDGVKVTALYIGN
jgi:hypothetical protein